MHKQLLGLLQAVLFFTQSRQAIEHDGAVSRVYLTQVFGDVQGFQEALFRHQELTTVFIFHGQIVQVHHQTAACSRVSGHEPTVCQLSLKVLLVQPERKALVEHLLGATGVPGRGRKVSTALNGIAQHLLRFNQHALLEQQLPQVALQGVELLMVIGRRIKKDCVRCLVGLNGILDLVQARAHVPMSYECMDAGRMPAG
ncbi:hypothetical protein D3C79_792310 [compost metagenome]